MTLPQVYPLFDYWRAHPPEHELIAIGLQAYTTWRPDAGPMTPEEHRKSLEARWKAGAMNVKQIFEATGGAMSLNGARGPGHTGGDLPGIGPFPGTVH